MVHFIWLKYKCTINDKYRPWYFLYFSSILGLSDRRRYKYIHGDVLEFLGHANKFLQSTQNPTVYNKICLIIITLYVCQYLVV